MSSGRDSRQKKEKERLEALQNTERRFLNGMYGDFFGRREGTDREETGETGGITGSGETGETSETRGSAGGLTFGRVEEAGKKIAKKADGFLKRQKEMSSALEDRRDALKRANDALREVQSLLDNPLYDGMPTLTGAGGAAGGKAGNGGSAPAAGPGTGEIDPGLMAGSGGDLFSGFAGNGQYTDPGQEKETGTGQETEPGAPAGPGQGDGLLSEAGTDAAGRAQEPEKDPMEELDSLIGLTKIKHDVKELMDFVKIQKLRKDGGLKSVPVSLHLVFTGNPGTGKTTVARILARLYQQIGVLSKGQLVEVDRSGLVAGYVGQTALKTAKKIEEAKGGVLFIDEAYALARRDDTFGQEAIDTILKAMEDSREDFVVIVAGYTEPMETFINSNPGLKSRFNKYIDFPDYTIDELMGIFDMNCKKYDYEADDDVRAQVRHMITQRRLAARENFANAREVRNLFEEIITNQARRVAGIEAPTQEDMKKILTEDLTETAMEDAARTLDKAAAAEEKSTAETERAGAKEEGTETGVEAGKSVEEPGEAGADVEKTGAETE